MATKILTPFDFSKLEAYNFRLQNLSAAPASPALGQLYLDTDDNIMYWWNGTAWQSAAAGAPTGPAGGGLTGTYPNPDVANDHITFARMQNIVTDRLIGRDTAGTGDPEEISVSGGLEWTGGAGIQRSALTGDVTAAAGSAATTIANDAVSNAKLANMPANTIKGNNTAGVADPVDLTAAQTKALLAIVPGDVAGFDTQVRTNRLDQMAVPTAAVAFNGQKATGLADGTNAQDAVTFSQLNAIVNNQTWKATADAMTTAALPAVTATTTTLTATANGVLGAQDGVTLANGDTLLVKDQAAPAQDGIYVVTDVGSAGTPFILTRRADADTAAELSDATLLVDNGTTGKGDIYTFPAITTLGTTSALPVKTGEGNTVYTADGSTIILTGTQFSIPNGGITGTQLNASVAGSGLGGGGGSALAVNVDGTTVEVSGDAVRLAATAAGNGLTGGGGAALDVGAGTGIAVTANAVAVDRTGTNNAHVPQKFAATIGDGAATSIAVTHNLNTRDVQVQVYDATTFETVWCDVVRTSATVVTLVFAVAPAANAYRVVIFG